MAGIKPDVTSLAENTPPEGAVAALNGSGASGYTGPCPPSGATHTYRITVHYLDRALLLSSGGAAVDMRAAIDEATLATAQVTGTFRQLKSAGPSCTPCLGQPAELPDALLTGADPLDDGRSVEHRAGRSHQPRRHPCR